MLAHPEAPVGADAARRYRADLERRATGEPVAYLRGLKEFYGLAFEADARALIPRPETERLVELAEAEVMHRLGAVAASCRGGPASVVDVGTGSGAIAVALATVLRGCRALEAVEIVATDISPDALGLARENAVGHAVADRIRFVEADLLPVGEAHAASMSSWPTCRTSGPMSSPRCRARRRSSPWLALDGGPDGLASSSGCSYSCRTRSRRTGSR